jgi:hypothetical protein
MCIFHRIVKNARMARVKTLVTANLLIWHDICRVGLSRPKSPRRRGFLACAAGLNWIGGRRGDVAARAQTQHGKRANKQAAGNTRKSIYQRICRKTGKFLSGSISSCMSIETTHWLWLCPLIFVILHIRLIKEEHYISTNVNILIDHAYLPIRNIRCCKIIFLC